MAPPPDTAHAGLAAMTRLRRIAETLAGTDDGEWLAEAMFVYEYRAPEGGRLDEAFGLAPGPGQEPWFAAERRAVRDEAIRELVATFDGSISARSLFAAEAIRRYGATGWSQDRARGEPLTSDVRRKLLFTIFSADKDPPKSSRRVYDIVKG